MTKSKSPQAAQFISNAKLTQGKMVKSHWLLSTTAAVTTWTGCASWPAANLDNCRQQLHGSSEIRRNRLLLCSRCKSTPNTCWPCGVECRLEELRKSRTQQHSKTAAGKCVHLPHLSHQQGCGG